MNIFWGTIMIVVGTFLSIAGFLKSEFFIYRILVARSKILWGDKVHGFYAIIGILVAIMGILLAIGIFKR
jgi:hypothetical protein